MGTKKINYMFITMIPQKTNHLYQNISNIVCLLLFFFTQANYMFSVKCAIQKMKSFLCVVCPIFYHSLFFKTTIMPVHFNHLKRLWSRWQSALEMNWWNLQGDRRGNFPALYVVRFLTYCKKRISKQRHTKCEGDLLRIESGFLNYLLELLF